MMLMLIERDSEDSVADFEDAEREAADGGCGGGDQKKLGASNDADSRGADADNSDADADHSDADADREG